MKYISRNIYIYFLEEIWICKQDLFFQGYEYKADGSHPFSVLLLPDIQVCAIKKVSHYMATRYLVDAVFCLHFENENHF